MPQRRERRWPWIAAGYALLFAVIAALAAFIHDAAAPAHQPMVIRLAVALAVAVMLIHLRAHFRGDPRWEAASAFEHALSPQPAAAKLDAGFVKLRNDVASGVASRSFFDKILWLRLCDLARARGHSGEIPPPAERAWLGRGPSVRAIAALIDRIATSRTGK